MERRFLLVDIKALPEVFVKVLKAKELLASGAARNISAATRTVGMVCVSASSFSTGFTPLTSSTDKVATSPRQTHAAKANRATIRTTRAIRILRLGLMARR